MRRATVISATAFRALLRCYPEEFRRRFGREMNQVFQEQLRDAGSERGLLGMVRVWFAATTEILTAALPQHLQNPSRMAAALSLIGSFVLCAAFLRAVSR
jgi:hypothetical protein